MNTTNGRNRKEKGEKIDYSEEKMKESQAKKTNLKIEEVNVVSDISNR